MELIDQLEEEVFALNQKRREMAQKKWTPELGALQDRLFQELRPLELELQRLKDENGVTRQQLLFALPRLFWNLEKASLEFRENPWRSQAEFEWAWMQLNTAFRRLEFLGEGGSAPKSQKGK